MKWNPLPFIEELVFWGSFMFAQPLCGLFFFTSTIKSCAVNTPFYHVIIRMMKINRFCELIGGIKWVKFYFQPGPLSKVFTVVNLSNSKVVFDTIQTLSFYFVEYTTEAMITTKSGQSFKYNLCHNEQDTTILFIASNILSKLLHSSSIFFHRKDRHALQQS